MIKRTFAAKDVSRQAKKSTSSSPSSVTSFLINLVETSEAATALVELWQVCTTNSPECKEPFLLHSSNNNQHHCKWLHSATSYREVAQFETVRPDDFLPKALFNKFENDHWLLNRLLAMTVMVISYLDSPWGSKVKSNGQSIKLEFIKQLNHWYYHVNAPNVMKKTKSYLCNEESIVSGACVTFSNASIDARDCIAKIKGPVKIGTREPLNIDDFSGDLYQRILLLTMMCPFDESDYYETEFIMFIQQITHFVSYCFTALLLLASPDMKQKQGGGRGCG
jgi:hypothetical protein